MKVKLLGVHNVETASAYANHICALVRPVLAQVKVVYGLHLPKCGTSTFLH